MTLSEFITRLQIIQSEVEGDPFIELYEDQFGYEDYGYKSKDEPFCEVTLLYHTKNKDGEIVVRIE